MINSSKTRSENQQDLDNYRKKFEEIKKKIPVKLKDWDELVYQDYPELVEWLISDLEFYVKREQELFDIENHILWVDYRDYKFKIYLDAERNTLVGDVLLNNEIDVTGIESDSLTHVLTELERQVDNQINYRYQSQLAEENIKLEDKVARLKTILPKDYFKNEQNPEATKRLLAKIAELKEDKEFILDADNCNGFEIV